MERSPPFFSKLLGKTGALQKNNRWWSWNIKMRGQHEDDGLLLLLVGYQIIVRGEVESLADLKNFGGIAANADMYEELIKGSAKKAGEAAAPAGEHADMKAVKDSNHVTEAIKRKTGVGRAMVLATLANSTARRMALIRCRLTEQLEHRHSEAMEMLTTKLGSLEWYVQQACGSYNKTLREVWALLQDQRFLNEICLTRSDLAIGAHLEHEQQILADLVVTFARNIVFFEIQSNAWYSHRPPFAFMKFLSREQKDRDECMAFARVLYTAVIEQEANERGVGRAADLSAANLKALLWPRNQWVLGKELNFNVVLSIAVFQIAVEAGRFCPRCVPSPAYALHRPPAARPPTARYSPPTS